MKIKQCNASVKKIVTAGGSVTSIPRPEIDDKKRRSRDNGKYGEDEWK